jgi:hypothetical protein
VTETQDALIATQEDVLDLQEDIEKLKKEPRVIYQDGGIGKQQVFGFIRQAVADGVISTSAIEITTPDEIVNASNTTFSVTAKPKWVVADGIMYFDGAGYTYGASQIVMDIPPSQFIRVII